MERSPGRGASSDVNDLFLTIVPPPAAGPATAASSTDLLRALRGTGKAEAAALQAADRRELDSARDSLLSALAPTARAFWDSMKGPPAAAPSRWSLLLPPTMARCVQCWSRQSRCWRVPALSSRQL
ncbi:hypothetical protein ACRAWD_04415 [Caulobacter segnis]